MQQGRKEEGSQRVKECWRGRNCDRPDCRFYHPPPAYSEKDSSHKSRRAVNAPRGGQAGVQEVRACWWGQRCSRQICRFYHPPPTYNEGSSSYRPRRVQHSASPRQRVHQDAATCWFGRQCTRPGCRFSHPPPYSGGSSGRKQREGPNEAQPEYGRNQKINQGPGRSSAQQEAEWTPVRHSRGASPRPTSLKRLERATERKRNEPEEPSNKNNQFRALVQSKGDRGTLLKRPLTRSPGRNQRDKGQQVQVSKSTVSFQIQREREREKGKPK